MKRQWVIKSLIMNGRRVVVFHGSFKEACDKGLLEETFKRIIERDIEWEYFNNKKDFQNRLNEMEVLW